jgi:hypothetical protein
MPDQWLASSQAEFPDPQEIHADADNPYDLLG